MADLTGRNGDDIATKVDGNEVPAFVLDCSLTLSWFLPDESDQSRNALLDRLADEGGVVPSLWPLEVANALLIAQRRRRVTRQQRQSAILALRRLPIAIDVETTVHAWNETLRLAEHLRLTIYDATYVELARRLALPLGTLDRELRAAGKAAGIEVIGL